MSNSQIIHSSNPLNNTTMYTLILALLLTTINAATPVPTPSPSTSGSALSPAPTDSNSPTASSGPTPIPTFNVSPVPTPPPSSGSASTPIPTSNVSPVPTPPPSAGSGLSTSPTASSGPTPIPTSNGSPSNQPTPSPTTGSGPNVSPAPTDSNSPTAVGSPSFKPTPSPSAGSGLTQIPTINGAVSTLPTMSLSPGTVPTPPPSTDNIGVPSPGPTPSPVSSPVSTPYPTRSPIAGALSRCISTDNLLDIIFIIDSSGSVWDDGYKNWENELELVYDIIDNVLPLNSRIGLINFSGCGTSYSYIDCLNQGRLKRMISLTDNGTPNDLDAVLSTVDAIDQEDFLGGYTWTNEALGLALTEFVALSASDNDKIIILITDGEPYPYDQSHEPCKSSTGYVSDTLQSLRELGVGIITVGIDIDNEYIKEEYFDCISGTDFYFEGTFYSSSSYSYLPTFSPTPSPVSGRSGISAAPTSQAQAISDGDTPTLMPTSGSNGSPTANGVPSPGPTPSPVSGTSEPTIEGVTTLPTANAVPGTVPTLHPTSTGTGTSLAPTSDSNGSPTAKPSPSPTIEGMTTLPTANGVPTPGPTPSPVSPGTVPTLHPTSNVMHGVPTYYPSPSPIMAVEDLSDSIGDFICTELGSSRMVIPTVEPTPMPTSEVGVPTTHPTFSPIGSIQGECVSNNDLDIVFMVDSSGSVYDDGYNNWQSELDLVYDIINSLPSTSTRASLINFSGCGSSFSLIQCKEQGRLDTVFNLNRYNYNLDMISSRIEEMDSSDFKGGYTWTNEALGLALQQFNSYSDSDKTKIIVLLTDGEPYPYDQGHEPCITSTNYESDTLIALNELDVNIITVGIDISQVMKEEKLECVSESYFGVSQFNTLNSLSVEIGELICDKLDGDFSKSSLQPTPEPSPSPVSNPISLLPTPSPTNEDATQGPITSNGVMANIYINLAIISGFIGFLLVF